MVVWIKSFNLSDTVAFLSVDHRVVGIYQAIKLEVITRDPADVRLRSCSL
jgi:hypothetical protein